MKKLCVLLALSFCISSFAANEKPKLVVVWVIDQLRADYLTRYESRFLKARNGHALGGFEYLKSEGAYYPYAQYDILNSMTGPGHATILTGAYPYQHGIPLNIWYDHATQKTVYCVDDPSVKSVGPAKGEISGRSPKNLRATTVSDEYKMAGYPSRVFSIALKDRAAVLMGGHRADAAFWIDKKSLGWNSSTFYFKDGKLPQWVQNFNDTLSKKSGLKITWNQEGKPTGLSVANPFMLTDEWNAGSIGLQFPHEVKFASPGFFYTPDANDLVREFAETTVKENKLGRGQSVDFLFISFSSHDYLAHAFGLNSQEMEEMTVREDKTVSIFLNFLNKEIPGGIKNVVFALTGDHGGAPNPELMAQSKVDSGRILEDETLKKIEDQLTSKWGKPKKDKKWLGFGHDFHYFFDETVLKDRDVSNTDAEKEVKAVLSKINGVLHVVTQSEFDKNLLPALQHERQIKKTNFKGRSGDVFLIPKPYYVLDDSTTTHITGYNYDRTVPILISGGGIVAGRKPEIVEVVDLAPTLSYLIQGSLPSVSEGKLLKSALTK